MATVYLALQESLDREVVLKTMNPSNTESTDFLERFLNEGRIVASLRHPHIITIYDIGSTGDLVWIAMEYVEGGDLKSRLCDAGFDCSLSIPSITSGKDFQIESKGWAVNEQFFFEFQEHIALVEAFIKNGS